MYAQLLIDLFKFLAPFLRNAELAKPVTLLYKGTLRVLLVLLHDFPEFLCDYHYGFCDVIPPNCIQVTEQTESLICAFLRTFLIKSSNKSKQVKCTLVQALRLCTGRTAHRGSRGVALLFHDRGTRRG
jgi:hypothetical protein